VHSHAWRAARLAARCFRQMPPANERRTSTNGRRVSSLGSRTLAQGWKDHSRAIWETRETPLSSRRKRCGSLHLTPGITAAIAIEPRHGFERTDFERLTEYVAGRNRSPVSVATFISEHALFPLIFRSKRYQQLYLRLKTLAACPLGFVGSHLLARLTEHPCSIADDAIAPARPPCCPSCTVRAGRPQVPRRQVSITRPSPRLGLSPMAAAARSCDPSLWQSGLR
jgi:hypothetical protein